MEEFDDLIHMCPVALAITSVCLGPCDELGVSEIGAGSDGRQAGRAGEATDLLHA